MPNDNLLSVTPIDGRYESQTKSLANYFSEFALIKTRVEVEIEWLLRSLLSYNRLDLYLKFDESLTKQQLKILKKWIKRRLKNEPLQYITQSCSFYGRNFFVNSDVLIPRPETERLIDIALEKAKKIEFPKIFDVGTGSGCISITLALEIPDSQVYGSDISKKAIKIANNLVRGKGRMLVRKSGTEPKIRIMCESENKILLKKCINIVKKSIN